MLDAAVITYVLQHPPSMLKLQRMGVDQTYFVDDYRSQWLYLQRHKREHDQLPSLKAFRLRFPDFHPYQVTGGDMPEMVSELRKRKRYQDFLKALDETISQAHSHDGVDDAIQGLQSRLNSLAHMNGRAHLVNLFDKRVSEKMMAEVQRRRSGKTVGIPTGLPRFDAVAGGLQRQRMTLVIGRISTGKSWIADLAVATSVLHGYKAILYPLEMSLTETAFRLYTLFSSQAFGLKRILRNYDLTTGKVTRKKMVAFLHALEDKLEGSLYVADVGSLSDPYTVERIEAEVEMLRPDMFWVDYITLLKPVATGGADESWQAVRTLSSGIKSISMRHNVVGGATAQVNREAVRIKVMVPRLEHIAYGDALGQDADSVLSIAKKGKDLFYSLVKNRGGPEFGVTKARFRFDEGIFEEIGPVEEDDT